MNESRKFCDNRGFVNESRNPDSRKFCDFFTNSCLSRNFREKVLSDEFFFLTSFVAKFDGRTNVLARRLPSFPQKSTFIHFYTCFVEKVLLPNKIQSFCKRIYSSTSEYGLSIILHIFKDFLGFTEEEMLGNVVEFDIYYKTMSYTKFTQSKKVDESGLLSDLGK